MRHLQIIGEAARMLPEEVRALAPGVEWSRIIGMRNVLVHGYFAIDLDIVWEAASRDAPDLRPAVERLLKRLEEQGGKCPAGMKRCWTESCGNAR